MASEKRLVCLDSVIEQLENEWGYEGMREDLYKLPTVDAIPIAVMKMAIDGINMEDQADQAGIYSYRLRNALCTVLEWHGCPAYKEYERRCK